MRGFAITTLFSLAITGGVIPAPGADSLVLLRNVPDYGWHAGCFGTATGNLMGFWDRNGFPDFYTGPTGGGLAPTNSLGANFSIRAMWASEAGVDGRPSNQPGHINDYWRNEGYAFSGFYESPADDPYTAGAGRAEHEPDCIGDFIGLSQKKWVNMSGECDGNINAYSYVYWDYTGAKRVNFSPSSAAGEPARDIQSGLKEWAKWRGYECDVFTQLTDFNPNTPAGAGFTFEDLKAEINEGYPVMVFMQPFTQYSRVMAGMPKANPSIHGMLIYGYGEYMGSRFAYYRSSWGGAFIPEEYLENFAVWAAVAWEAQLPVRGVIGFRPKPRIRTFIRQGANLTFEWDGPSVEIYEPFTEVTRRPHTYVVERTESLSDPEWTMVGSATALRTMTVSDPGVTSGFYRVRLNGGG